MTGPTDALSAFAAANPVNDPALLPRPYADGAEFLDAHRPRRPPPPLEPAPLAGRIRRALMVVLAFCFAAGAVAAVASGVWVLLRADGTTAAPSTTLPATTTPPTTAAPVTMPPLPTTTTTAPPIVIQPTRVIGSGSTYNGSFPAIALFPDGIPVLAFLDGDGAEIRIAVCADRECRSFSGTTSITQ